MQVPSDPNEATIAAWNELAQRYEDKFMGLSIYDEAYRAFFCLLPENGKVLEVGAGPGIVADFAARHFPQMRLLVTDAAHEMVKRSRTRFPHFDHRVLKAQELLSVNEQFDGIVASFCIPYLREAEVLAFINHATKRLHPGGALYISFMEDDYANSGLQKGSTGHEMMVYYYPEKTVCAWLKEAGYHIVERLDLPPGDLTPKRQCMLVATTEVQPRGCSVSSPLLK